MREEQARGMPECPGERLCQSGGRAQPSEGHVKATCLIPGVWTHQITKSGSPHPAIENNQNKGVYQRQQR